MVAVLREEPHFDVPARVHEPGEPADSNRSRLLLAARIAQMPGIRTVENGRDGLPHSVTVFLDQDRGPARKRMPPRTLCIIRRDGISVHGLKLGDRRHLAMRGWGTLQQDRVHVFLPRNGDEVDTCWKILQHAHCSLLDFSTRPHVARHVPHGDLPRFSRTTLQ